MEEKKPFFPILEGEIARRGIKKKDIANKLGISERAFANKLNGKSDLWWSEVITIHNIFPNISTERLFSTNNA